MGTQAPSSRTINAKTALIIIAVVLAVVIGIGAAVAPSSQSSTDPVAVQSQPDDVSLHLQAAIKMIDEGRLDLPGIKRIRSGLGSRVDRSSGEQLTSYAGFLWAASEATRPADLATSTDFQNEGMDALTRAESLGWTNAYISDGAWRGEALSLSTKVALGSSDPRTDCWPIIAAVDKWSAGASKGDPQCKFLMDQLAPSWSAAASIMQDIRQGQSAFEAKKQSGEAPVTLQQDLAALDDLKTRWIAESGMVSVHLSDHPQHPAPCWDWVNEKSGALMGQWSAAHPRP